jgi:hypothetical protein
MWSAYVSGVVWPWLLQILCDLDATDTNLPFIWVVCIFVWRKPFLICNFINVCLDFRICTLSIQVNWDCINGSAVPVIYYYDCTALIVYSQNSQSQLKFRITHAYFSKKILIAKGSCLFWPSLCSRLIRLLQMSPPELVGWYLIREVQFHHVAFRCTPLFNQ